jgi:large subunit ribosomal protein L2
MAVRRFKPTTPSLRGTRLEDRSMLSKEKPPKSLTSHKSKITGRNNQGKVTVRHRGGGMKRRHRIVDFKRDKYDIPAKVVDLYFDPNRSAHLALLQYADGEKRFIIAPRGMQAGDSVISGESADIILGNAMKLKNVPPGTEVHCVESKPGNGAAYGRSAGQIILVQGPDPSGKYMQLKMPSGEIRLVHGDCMATIGQVGNEDKMNVKLGKAGRKRRLGWRPTVRGLAMHSVQHPHGGGEGSGKVGQAAKDIWGNRVGTRTRNNKRTEKYIIKRRRTRRRPFAKK